MLYNLEIYFLLFIIYSILGYIIEVLYVSFNHEKITLSRGFLIGPVLPIYGVGAVFITLLLSIYENQVLTLFTLSMVLCTILEYYTSLILEKIFKLRWWDYKDKKHNLNGRVCLQNALLFGLGGVVIIEYINPIIFKALYSYLPLTIKILVIISLIIFLLDLIISTKTIFTLKDKLIKLGGRDSTHQIRLEVKEYLTSHSKLLKRLIKAFPNLVDLNKTLKIPKLEKYLLGRKGYREFNKKRKELKRKNKM